MTLDSKKIERISKALGDPYRLKIMHAIRQQEKQEKKQCSMPCSIIVEMIDLAQSTVSHHIKQLVDADLLIANKDVFNAYVDFLKPFGG
jgi:ArsR family transcriptional regulator, arsenate/arsenite/antimonite-responsive transcriptional repressor